jgi:hypothetical protein
MGAACDPCSIDPFLCKRPPLPPRCAGRPDGPGCEPCGIDPSKCKPPAPPTPCAKIGGCKPCWIEPWLCHPPTEPPPEDSKMQMPPEPAAPARTWLPNGPGGGVY